MSDTNIKSVEDEQKIIEDEFLEDGEMFEDEGKFWKGINIKKEQKRK
jgi:hypothetical protein